MVCFAGLLHKYSETSGCKCASGTHHCQRSSSYEGPGVALTSLAYLWPQSSALMNSKGTLNPRCESIIHLSSYITLYCSGIQCFHCISSISPKIKCGKFPRLRSKARWVQIFCGLDLCFHSQMKTSPALLLYPHQKPNRGRAAHRWW